MPPDPASDRRRVLVIAMYVMGGLSPVAMLWLLLVSFALFPELRVALHAAGYRRATFVVERIVGKADRRCPGRAKRSRLPCRGMVGGSVERLSLLRTCRDEGPSGEALAEHRPGERIQVLYNPEMTAARLQGSYLRVLRYRPDFEATQWLLVRAMARTAFLPLALTAVPAFGLWAYLRRSASQLPNGLWWPDFAGLLFTLMRWESAGSS